MAFVSFRVGLVSVSCVSCVCVWCVLYSSDGADGFLCVGLVGLCLFASMSVAVCVWPCLDVSGVQSAVCTCR